MHHCVLFMIILKFASIDLKNGISYFCEWIKRVTGNYNAIGYHLK